MQLFFPYQERNILPIFERATLMWYMLNTRVVNLFDFTGSFTIVFVFILMFLLIVLVFFTIKVLCTLTICFLFGYSLPPG